MVNTGQQVGGSIGTSLLNTVAASAAATYLAAHATPRLMTAGHPAPALAAMAQVHSYSTAFWWAAAMFAAGAVLAALLFPAEGTSYEYACLAVIRAAGLRGIPRRGSDAPADARYTRAMPA